MGRPLSDEYIPIISHDMDPKYQSLVTIPFAEENPSAPEIPLNFHSVVAKV